MQRLALLAFAVAIVLATAVVLVTAEQLPPLVASHFHFDGSPDQLVTRGHYVTLMLLLTCALPIVIAGGTALAVRKLPSLVNIPHRDYWLQPPRRAATLAYVTTHMLWIGTLLAAFMAAMHALVVSANATQPPRLPALPFAVLVAGLVTVVAASGTVLWLHFRRADSPTLADG